MNYILGIETSCDETSAAVVDTNGKVLANVIASQIDTHKEYGGVIPEIASRMHVEAINLTTEQALQTAQKEMRDIAAIAVTYGPGLLGALLIGLQAAKTLSYIHKIPLIGINHMEGHIFANFLDKDKFAISYPYLCLIVSGGHTQLVIAEKANVYKTIARTIDDAAGEAYDKVARLLQLGYPGGPIIDKIAKTGNSQKIKFSQLKLKDKESLNFSFSGLKTAVVNYYRKNPQADKADICASFQQAVVEQLVVRTITAAKKYQITNVYLAGGVSANSALREAFSLEAKKSGINLAFPPMKYCTDNAAMIAGAAIPKYLDGKYSGLNIKAEPNLKI